MKYQTVLCVGALLLSQAAAQASTFTNAEGEQMECRKVRVVHHRQWGTGGTVGTLAGGALGGLAGSQFGKGSGNSAMTAAGAVGGAVVGHEVGKQHDTYVTYEERCKRIN